MTKNNLRVNCYCLWKNCQGKLCDYRTERSHAAKDTANRPRYPEDNKHQEAEQMDPVPPSVVLPPSEEEWGEDIYSHVENLPNCNEPVYETVSMCMHVFCVIPEHIMRLYLSIHNIVYT